MQPNEMPENRLLIDASGIAYAAMYAIRKPGYEPARESEMGEYARAVAARMLLCCARFPEHTPILCLDYPLRACEGWRSRHMREWYENNSWAYTRYSPTGIELVVTWDKKWYKVSGAEIVDGTWTWPNVPGKSPLVKLTKDQIPEEVELEDTDADISRLLPRYKGNRPKDWPFSISKDEWRHLTYGLMKNLAQTLGGFAVGVEGAEADDVAWVAADGAVDLAIVTEDFDWVQTLDRASGVTAWIKDEEAEVLMLSAETRWEMLMEKIIGGDVSDNICGCLPRGGSTLIAGKKAAKMVQGRKGQAAALWLELEALLWAPSLERNLDLVVMDNIPPQIQRAIGAEILKQDLEHVAQYAKYKDEDFGIEPTDVMQIISKAKALGRVISENV